MTGKTSLINYYNGLGFNEKLVNTIGIDYCIKNIKSSDNNEYKLRIYDTAGMEKYKSVTLSILKRCKGIILVYSIDNKQSFENIRYKWINDIKDHINISEVPIILVGNKKDLENERIISKEEGRKVAEENNFLFFETSAKTGTNIEEAFNQCTSEIVTKIENGGIVVDSFYSGIKIGKYPNKEIEQALVKKKKGCC